MFNIWHVFSSYELDPDDGYGGKILPYNPHYGTRHQNEQNILYRPAVQHQHIDKFTKYPFQQTPIEPYGIGSTTIKPINKFGYKNNVATVSFSEIDSTFHQYTLCVFAF